MEGLDKLVLERIVSNLSDIQDIISLSSVCSGYRRKIISLPLLFRVDDRREEWFPKINIVNLKGIKNGICSRYKATGILYHPPTIIKFLTCTETYKDGILNGPRQKYYQTGKLRKESFYIKGKKEGTFISYRENGVIELLYFYQDNLLNGEYKNFQPDGSVRIRTNYKNGKEHGIRKVINKDNYLLKTESLTHYKDGKKCGFYYHTENNIVTAYGINKDDLTQSEYLFHPNGHLQTYTRFSGELGVYLQFYNTGRLKIYKETQRHENHGMYIEFCPEGNIICSTYYSYGKRHGEYRRYVGDIVCYIAHYNNNLLHGPSLRYSSDGILLEKTHYKYGHLHGWSTQYNIDGIVARKEYRNGKPIGVCKIYQHNKVISYRLWNSKEEIKPSEKGNLRTDITFERIA